MAAKKATDTASNTTAAKPEPKPTAKATMPTSAPPRYVSHAEKTTPKERYSHA